MNKTLYVKDSEAEIWESAEKLALNGISPLVTELLRDYVRLNRPPDAEGLERIEVETKPTDESKPIKKAFVGRVLVGLDERIGSDEDVRYLIAQTKQNRFAIYVKDRYNGTSDLHVVENLEALRKTWPEDLVATVSEKLGRPFVVELDI